MIRSPRRPVILALLLAATVAAAPKPLQSRTDVSQGFADLAEQLLPSVVNISTSQKVEQMAQPAPFPEDMPGRSPFEDWFREFFENRPTQRGPRQAMSLGSGFVIDAKAGLVVTNNHVIEGADEINVVLQDNHSVPAEVVGSDEKTDLAVLRVTEPVELKAVTWGNSDKVRVGDWVLAIGNPFGLGGTVTAGIISARARNINAGPYDDFLQTDASINRGNSGGPMFDADGQVIGINTAIYSPTGGSVGIGFAIPAALAKPVIDQLIEFGRTRRGWLGVKIQEVTPDIAEGLGLEEATGALVAEVTPGGPADAAGLKAGDVIVNFGERGVGEMRTLPRIVAETEVGETVPVEFLRAGKRQNVEVTVGELEQAEESGVIASDTVVEQGNATVLDGLGLSVAAITPAAIEDFGLDPQITGVVITEVSPDSEAYEKRLRPGDVIREFNQTEVTSPDTIKAQIEAIKAKADQRNVLVFVSQRGVTRFVTLRVE